MKYRCAQRGCTFDASKAPDVCPVCNNPFIDAGDIVDDELPWSEYPIDELRDYATNWGLDGWNSRTNKADLIALLEAAEAADADEPEDGE